MKLKLLLLSLLTSAFMLAQQAPSYYSNIDFTATGNTMKSQLAALITSTHKTKISYDDLKTLYKTSDADPDKSGNILLIYGSVNTTDNSEKRQRSRSYSGSWNREHVYAKSKGTPNLGTSGPGSDGHHLRPADISLNSERGSLSFTDGAGATAGKTNGGWFPGDEWKGDVARILMYMYVRYGNQCLPKNITSGPSTYSSDFPDVLLKWNIEDPVSAFEVQRNNVTASWQGNRNPFIDNPYLATVIWGGPNAENKWPESFGQAGTPDTEKPTAPANLTATATTSSSVSLSWTAATDNIVVTAYEVYADENLKTTVNTTSATVSGLTPATTYSFYVIARDAAGNKSDISNTIQATTDEGSGNGDGGTSCGTETFENMPESKSNYETRTWISNNVTWTATQARTDLQLDGRALCMKGTLTSSTISGGVGSLTLTTYLPYSDSAGEMTLLINGIEKGKIPFSKKTETFTISDINVEGNAVIEIRNQSGRVVMDNLTWTCYQSSLGINDNKTSGKLKVYPNPVKNGEFVIAGIRKSTNITIYNLNGQMVQTIKGVSDKSKVLLKKLPKGVYIVKTPEETTKIIVE